MVGHDQFANMRLSSFHTYLKKQCIKDPMVGYTFIILFKYKQVML